MPGATADEARRRTVGNAALFFRRWLANPPQTGSVVPSSLALCRRIAALATRGPGEAVLELGAASGLVNHALSDAGVPPERLLVVEIVPDMAEHSRLALPGVDVLCGDAIDLARIVPKRWHGRTGRAICGLPLVLLPIGEQRRVVQAVEFVAPGRGFLIHTYCITSPLPYRRLELTARRGSRTARSLPPASVRRYRNRGDHPRTHS